MLGTLPRPACSVVGPFLGALGDTAVRVCIGLPGTSHASVTCTLSGAGRSRAATATATHGAYRLFRFDFDDLDPDAEYHYSFAGDAPIDLEGLQPEELRFRPLGHTPKAASFALATCNNPFESGTDDQSAWALWSRLGALLDGDDPPRLLVLAGDQVYHDVLEAEYIDKLEASPRDRELLDDLRADLIENYQRYWGDLSLRRVVARVPSVAMWDDHDITDGWGGRLESFTADDQFKPGWMAFFEAAREAFAAYQTSRNPAPLPGVPDGSFTSRLDWGDTSFFLCDFRSEKNSRKDQFWSRDQEAAFASSLRACPAELVFLVSPVVPFRADPDHDARVTGLAKFAWQAQRAAADTGSRLLKRTVDTLLRGISWLVPLVDDLEDGLLAKNNRVSFLRLLDELFAKMADSRCDVVILSGDIHAAGISEFTRRTQAARLCIPQIVSSPIAHEAMPANIEGTSTTPREIALGDNGALTARNGAFFPDRNFAVIRPGRLRDYGAGLPVAFYLDTHEAPIALPAYLAPAGWSSAEAGGANAADDDNDDRSLPRTSR